MKNRTRTHRRALLSAGVAAVLSLAGAAMADQVEGPLVPEGKLIETPVTTQRMLRVVINLRTGELTQSEYEVPASPSVDLSLPPGVDGMGCDETVSHTDASFQGGQYIAQAGFAEHEAAGASYVLTPAQFPLLFRSAEMIFATSSTTVPTTTQWSLLIYSGTPATGSLVDVFSSDDVILPHIVIPPGTNGVNVTLVIDPSDPDQVVIPNSGNSTYSVAFRIDKHNNQTQNPCLFAPPTTSNAFPTTDVSGVSSPANNWLLAVDCGLLGCPAGWTSFASLPFFCRPSGDWVIRSTYTAFDCAGVEGGCCLLGSCELTSSLGCAAMGGVFQGAGTGCDACSMGACCFTVACALLNEEECLEFLGVFQGAGTTCTESETCERGACCLPEGDCTDAITPAECLALGGLFQGDQTNCSTTNCPDPSVPCCFASTGGCFEIGYQVCLAAGGYPGPVGQTCATYVCFPVGACCLFDGSCVDGLSPQDCNALDGVFQGHTTTCATTNCPLPTGACCLPNGNCLTLLESNCLIASGSWAGPGTTCADSNGNGTADACESPAPSCPPDLDGNGLINADDLGILLNAFGTAGQDGDLNQDGVVNADDLGILLSAFGTACK